MKKYRLQFSVKAVLVLSLVAAAYFAGRTPWERQFWHRTKRLADSERMRKESAVHSNLWRELALASRNDLRESECDWDVESATRFGNGGSFPGTGIIDESIRPREKRWKILFADDPAKYAAQLKTLQIEIVGVWDEPPKVMRWLPDANDFVPVHMEEGIERRLILAGDHRDFRLLPDRVFDDPPRLVLKAMSKEVERQFAIAENNRCNMERIALQDIATTSFALLPSKPDLEITVESIKMKAAP